MTAQDAAIVLRRVEALEIDTVWFPETAGGNEVFSQAAVYLSATSTVRIGTGIANIWARDPQAAANGARVLAEAFPGRFRLGLGISHREVVEARGHQFEGPLATVAEYLRRMRTAPSVVAKPAQPAQVILAALGPRMMQIARTEADGAFVSLVGIDATIRARADLGPGKHLLVSHLVAPGDLATAAQQFRDRIAGFFLGLDSYRNHLVRSGWTAEDVAAGGRDNQIADLVATGTVDQIAARLDSLGGAGADEIALSMLTGGDPVEELVRLLA